MANIKTCYPTEDDIQWIIQSMESFLVTPFQKVSVKQLFEITPWSLISRCGGENKAYAAFLDYPYNNHYSKVWYESIKNTWEKSVYHGVKTFFLHFFVCESNIKSFAEDILKVTFRSIPSLEWCCILTEGSTQVDSEIAELFQEDKSMQHGDFHFWSMNRCSSISKIGIRRKQSEDYLSLKNMFSQMYGPFKNDDLKKFTLDFLDYGEDKCPTYKYFTFDDDNTYIGIADNDVGEAVGFIYATIQRVDLDLMNQYFQLETVYGLRKKHPADEPQISLGEDEKSESGSEESLDEEDELRELVANIIDDVVSNYDIYTCLNDVLDEVCEPTKKHYHRRFSEKQIADTSGLTDSNDFSLSNPVHLSVIMKYIKQFSTGTLTSLVNSPEFDANNESHMKLAPRLGKAIKNVEEDRIKQILNSNTFDPSMESFASISVHVMSYMPKEKLELFKKSQIGHQLYEKIMYQKALTKKHEKAKMKKNIVVPKLSFKDTQILLHYSIGRVETPVKKTEERRILPDNLKHFQYRNMGFLSGLSIRGKYRIQGSFSIPILKEPFGYEKRQDPESTLMREEESGIEKFEKYSVPDIEKEECFIQEIPYYNGGTNCFYVEQFAIEIVYEYQSLYLIMAAFEYFPRVDYCMLLLPYGTQQVPYLRSYFSTIPPRPFTAYEKELFVFHKAAFNRSYEVRLFTEEDLKGVKRLIQCSCLKEYLIKDLERNLKSEEKGMQSVVLLSEDKIFGVAIVKEMKEIEIIRRKYDIAERINMKYHSHKSQGQLLHCVLHPIFKSFSNVFLKEIMRLCQKSILYFKVYPTHLIPYEPSLWQSLCNVLEHFAPLKLTMKAGHKIKTYIVFNSNSVEDNVKKYEDKYYCLCYTCTKLVLKDKNVISSRIVVMGDSNIALGIIENLIYRYDCKYTNITIISKCGMPGQFKLDERCYILPIDTDYTKSRLDSLCLTAWVTIIQSEVVSIKRNLLRLRELGTGKTQHFSIGFDYLVICSDLQFQTLYPKKSVICKNRTKKEERFSLLSGLWQENYIVAKCPSNVFSISNAYEAAKVLNWLWRYFLKKVEFRKQSKRKFKSVAAMERDKKEERIVIYGNYLEAYSALAAIITEEFPLSKITLIKAKSNLNGKMYFSEFVEEAVDHVLTKCGLEIFMDATIEYDKEADEIFNLDVITEEGTIRIECCALLLFHDKKVNYNTFKILHKSPLSFTLPLCSSKKHPYLLINTNFQTNIRNIFAVGTTTEMHTTTNASIRFEECFYNKREIGMIVGEKVHKATTNGLNLTEISFPILTNPEVTYAKLPHEYFYIFITGPSQCFARERSVKKVANRIESLILGNLKTGAAIIPAPMTKEETDLLDKDVGSEERLAYQEFLEEMRNLEQGIREEFEEEIKVERIIPDEPDYFALTFDENEAIKTIECLTKMNLDVITLKYLYGVHVTQLYKILHKVQKETDIVCFRLNETWILPLDHVVFEEEDIKPRKRGYESYWRPGYPKNIEKRLNAFLDSFTIYKGNKK